MERLTSKHWKEIKRHCFSKGIYFSNQFTEEESDEMIKRLCELEDKLESGQLVDLPCKVGDIFYIPKLRVFDYTDRTTKSGVLSYMVTNIGFSINKQKEQKTLVRLCLFVDGKTHDAQENFTFEEFSGNCYTEKDQAEERLKELEEKNG